jgi:hypothetical protein
MIGGHAALIKPGNRWRVTKKIINEYVEGEPLPVVIQKGCIMTDVDDLVPLFFKVDSPIESHVQIELRTRVDDPLAFDALEELFALSFIQIASRELPRKEP